jgi:SRSO17 transposase
VVTTHLYDGRKSLPLDIELYKHADSLPEGKQDPLFEKKTEIAIKLIDKTIERRYQAGIVIVDAGYGNNTSFLLELEKRKLKYLGGVAKNRKITLSETENNQQTIRLDELAKTLPREAFSEIQIKLDKPRTVWVATKVGLTHKSRNNEPRRNEENEEKRV